MPFSVVISAQYTQYQGIVTWMVTDEVSMTLFWTWQFQYASAQPGVAQNCFMQIMERRMTDWNSSLYGFGFCTGIDVANKVTLERRLHRELDLRSAAFVRGCVFCVWRTAVSIIRHLCQFCRKTEEENAYNAVRRRVACSFLLRVAFALFNFWIDLSFVWLVRLS